ncbi:MAG: hypothetical protein JST89_08530 [Cyanobacteria bacterium SZAS-4]|nr:hypothetical protein [Cyanobacteria bacterium SZAS-4]
MNNKPAFLDSLSIEKRAAVASWCPPDNWEDVLTGVRLATNDVYRSDAQGERLIMENGDSLKIKRCGKMHLSLSNENPRIDASIDGAFRVTYPNGDKICFDSKGLQSVVRGDQEVTFYKGVPSITNGTWLPPERRVLN